MALIRERLTHMLQRAVQDLLRDSGISNEQDLRVELEIPKISDHGDYATNAAMVLTKPLRRNPREIAQAIIDRMEGRHELLASVEIAGPGFINFFIRPEAWADVVRDIHAKADAYGLQDLGGGKRFQVEFVSANPTGPLHIGHGRGAAIGDVLANILRACGYQVDKEYYINDAGKQMQTLGRSLYLRYLEALGVPIDFPDDHYRGDYMKDLAREVVGQMGDRYKDTPEDEALPFFTKYAGDHILDGIRQDLEAFGVRHDVWFSEQSLHDAGEVQKTIEALEQAGYIYEEDGAKWFRSTAFGDEKDRVVVRANGLTTYFAADLAYHKNKFERDYDTVIDVWGADHHGYVARMSAGIQALGRKASDLRIILVQLVNLLRGGKPVAMSTRAGEFVTLREVVDEVGKDAARFIFLTRRSDSPLDFDLEVAKMQSNDNPVYYVQYAHARLCSVFQVAREKGVPCSWSVPPDLSPLTHPKELELMKLLGEYPQVVAASALQLEPHRIPYYLNELVSCFHSYYNQNRILGEEEATTQARLYLAAAVRTVIRNALGLLGVDAPEKM
ncbi:arginyl-tRNA synthetase [Desulfacinum hydrothermale DSM 13146]|uniref:Arginine--tRNA ligase n=1 Tax=Desulfacinum hydrothermale DSM 13146 TaxID=1121390 RepID=A0A1W1X9B0_9BACT|nr:arginine--tRNA ligase [Desulfacinum hydrothermale]SMC20479.1 arginyl-tRNA synthetase [Desulfacinum hydrothermale DSM 13146]